MNDENITHPKPEDDGKTQRPTGSYFCKIPKIPKMIPCCWDLDAGFWLVPGQDRPFIDSDFEEIDERRITREEPIAPKISGTTERTAQNE